MTKAKSGGTDEGRAGKADGRAERRQHRLGELGEEGRRAGGTSRGRGHAEGGGWHLGVWVGVGREGEMLDGLLTGEERW